MLPTDTFLLLLLFSSVLEEGDFQCCFVGDLGVRSEFFSLELAVVATETGCLGLELRRGGESLGGGVDIIAFSLELPPVVLAGVAMFRGGCFRLPRDSVGVLERLPVGVPLLECFSS